MTTPSSSRMSLFTSRPAGLDAEIRSLVTDTQPRLFAVVRECPDEFGDLDAWVAGWGLAYEDGSACVLSSDGQRVLSLRSPERATAYFARASGEMARLVWPERS